MTFKGYRKIKRLGHEDNKGIFDDPEDYIFIQEKMDGANFRFMVTDGEIIFGSRTQKLHESIDHRYSKNFERCISYVLDAFNNLHEDIKQQSNGKIFFGECMVKHTMNYDWDNIPPFLGFDIFATQSESYLLPKNVRNMYNSWNLDIVPLIEIVQAKDIKKIDDSIVPNSKYASPSSKDQKAEGIVFKNYDKDIFAKYVRDEFKERSAETFGGNPKYNKTDNSDNDKILFMYCTNARIDKCIFKLVDNGHKLDMPLMTLLPNMVYNDIIEEEWKSITNNKKGYTINFKSLHKMVTKRCVAVLKQIIVNNLINEKS